MRLLFVSAIPVFPPIDGARLPTSSYIEGLSRTHEIDFLLLDSGVREPIWKEGCEKTARAVNQFWKTSIRRKPRAIGLANELFGRAPSYGAWKFQEALPKELMIKQYDAAFVSTPPAIALLAQASVRQCLPSASTWVASLADVRSLALSKKAANASRNHSLFVRLYQRSVLSARSRILTFSELRMLDNYHWVFVQTEKEADWIRSKGHADLASRTIRMTNAVNEDLFSLPITRTGKKVVFVGSLSTMYGERFSWFIHNVWKHVRNTVCDMTLTAIGRDPSERLLKTMRDHDVCHLSYVEDLGDIYRNYDILVAPIFKGYGLINKVVEAMAAGCIVVGDVTAFNGIPSFVAGEHGFVANTQDEFVDVLKNALEDEEKLNSMRKAARQLMAEHFRWSQRIDTIEREVLSTATQ